jgi:hypothetical protein
VRIIQNTSIQSAYLLIVKTGGTNILPFGFKVQIKHKPNATVLTQIHWFAQSVPEKYWHSML